MSKHCSSNGKDAVDSEQRILEQYQKTPPGQGGVGHSSSSKGRSKGGRYGKYYAGEMINEVGKCEECGITTIDILTVHHKDGDHWNNRRANLQILCPNCHTQKSIEIAKQKGQTGHGSPVSGSILRRRAKSNLILPMLRKTHPELFELIVELSRVGFIYFGYYGYGSTKKYLKSQSYHGTQAILEKQKEQRTKKEYNILENLVLEGGIFATYDSLILHIHESEPLKEALENG